MNSNGRNIVTRSLDTTLTSSSSLDHFPEAKSPYNQVTHGLRKMVPAELACKIGCKGIKCKYDNSDWPQEKMAIPGIFSDWITDDILAMARPRTELINDHNLIHNMKKAEIRSIFNLQSRGEHKDCGLGLHKESGFSYNPIDFTAAGIYYYNYELEDYSIASSRNMIDMVKVLCFALQEGRAAVHCHAGLGRTGFFIACYLIYVRIAQTANEAIYMIRQKRPGSVQMQMQIDAVKEFEEFLRPLRIVYSDNLFTNNLNGIINFSLRTFLHRQKLMLHGYEAKKLKYIPKIIFVCGEQLRGLIYKWNADGVEQSTINKFSDEFIDDIMNTSRSVKNLVYDANNSPNVMIANSLLSKDFSTKILKRLEYYQRGINESYYGIDELSSESDPTILGSLIWSWLNHLKEPILKDQEINIVFKHIPTFYLQKSEYYDQISRTKPNWHELENGALHTINYLVGLLHELLPIPEQLENCLVEQLISSLTHIQLDHYRRNQPSDMAQISTHNMNKLKFKLLHKFCKDMVRNPIFVSNKKLGKFNFNNSKEIQKSYDYEENINYEPELREHRSRSRSRRSNSR